MVNLVAFNSKLKMGLDFTLAPIRGKLSKMKFQIELKFEYCSFELKVNGRKQLLSVHGLLVSGDRNSFIFIVR